MTSNRTNQCIYFGLIVSGTLFGGVSGFAPFHPQQSQSKSTTSESIPTTEFDGGVSGLAQEIKKNSPTSLHGTTKQPPFIPMPKTTSYGEESRRYRRTIYTHDDWIKHRAPTRFFRKAMTTFTSGIYANIVYPVMSATFIATFVVVWNALTGSYVDFRGIKHPGLLAGTFLHTLSFPMSPFTLSSASLGLLLVFRTNTGYSRWDEARKNWGSNINRTRDLLRMAVAWYDDKAGGKTLHQRQKDLTVLAKCAWAFVRTMKRHLSPDEDEEDFQKELFEKLDHQQAQTILNARHRPNRALFDLSVAIENLPMHFLRKNQLHLALTKFEDNLGSSERLLSSPVPLFYSRHTARFLIFWTLGLPFALYDHFATSWNHIMLIPASAFIATFLFGIEELANQMEEPFTILPQQAFCDKIYHWCMEMVLWRPGDNGMTIFEHSPTQYVNLE